MAIVSVTDALVMAIWRRGRSDALPYSPRSRQPVHQRAVPKADVRLRRSMLDEPLGHAVWDNAAMESFFSSLKTERTARKNVSDATPRRAADVFDYIECFYNLKRRHSTIGYLSPVEFEMQAGLA